MSHMRRHTASLILGGAVLASAGAAAGFAVGGTGEGLHLATRYTAWIACLLFLLTFTASTFHGAFGSRATAFLVRERRGLGLAFAAAHVIHLGFIVSFLAAMGIRPGVPVLVIGAPAYVGLAVLVVTSNDRSVAALGLARWRRLHTAAVWWIWLVFLLTFGGHEGKRPGVLIAVAVLLAAAAARLNRRFLVRRRQAVVGQGR